MVDCPRVLFNRELVLKMTRDDIYIEGDCDENVTKLCSLLGWKDSLLRQNETTKIVVKGDKCSAKVKDAASSS